MTLKLSGRQQHKVSHNTIAAHGEAVYCLKGRRLIATGSSTGLVGDEWSRRKTTLRSMAQRRAKVAVIYEGVKPRARHAEEDDAKEDFE